MAKNILIAVLALMLISVAVFAFQKSSDAEIANARATELAKEAQNMQQRAERLTKLAEQQAASATQAMADAMIVKEQLKKCKEEK